MNLFYDFLFILGILLSLIYIIILSKDKTLPNKILAYFFLMVILVLLDSYAFIHKIRTLFILVFLPVSSTHFLLGPLFYIYIKSLFYDDKVIFRKYWKVFIPLFFFIIFYSTPILIALISKQNFLGYIDIKNNYRQIIQIISDIVFLVYLAFCFNSFFKLKRIMKSTYSNIAHNNFIWIRYLLAVTAFIVSIDFFLETSQFFFDFFKGVRVQNFTMLFLVASIVYTAYFGLHQSKILVPYFLLENNTIVTENKQFLDKNSIKEFKRLEQNLQKIFIEEKPYLDTELTLSKLAEITTISDRKLSMLLNQYMNISFYDFVNDYRITAFKEAIKSDMYNKYTIDSIAFKCGFKSKASFYRVFKVKTNMSPSEFKKSLN